MTKLHQGFVKNVKSLPCLFGLLFALVGLTTATPNTHAASAATIPLPTTSLSNNWSGMEATSAVGKFKRVQCRAKVPTLNSNGDVSEWCGIGGDPTIIPRGRGNAVLVQAGVDSCLGPGCPGNNSNVQHNDVWWEIADALVVQPIRMSKGIHNGDDLYFYIESNIGNSGQDKFYIKNLTTKEPSHTIIINDQGATDNGNPISINTIGSGNGKITLTSDSASIECILERPLDAVSGMLAHLPVLEKPESITECDAGVGPSSLMTPIGRLLNVNRIKMFNNSGAGRVQGSNSARQGGQSPTVITDVSNFNCRTLDCFTVSNSNSRSALPATQGTKLHIFPGSSRNP
ncbi:MAG TPA: G1 family glutamic endopeptidase [Ktedonobacteraceae bacterium]|nr:G1 family glutamic endopeptidase [Ktedonobacteraceae bacterium]